MLGNEDESDPIKIKGTGDKAQGNSGKIKVDLETVVSSGGKKQGTHFQVFFKYVKVKFIFY